MIFVFVNRRPARLEGKRHRRSLDFWRHRSGLPPCAQGKVDVGMGRSGRVIWGGLGQKPCVCKRQQARRIVGSGTMSCSQWFSIASNPGGRHIDDNSRCGRRTGRNRFCQLDSPPSPSSIAADRWHRARSHAQVRDQSSHAKGQNQDARLPQYRHSGPPSGCVRQPGNTMQSGTLISTRACTYGPRKPTTRVLANGAAG